MKALKLDIYGRFAHFKNPENNKKIELTYDNIPKTVLLGQLGAILGLRGKQQERELGYIEYLEELKSAKISIIPHSPRWKKHVDEMVNSTGFANNGENQIIRRQVLEDVRWTIFILKDSVKQVHFDKLCEMLKARKSNFPLFLGKNEFKAKLGKVELVNLESIDTGEIEKCDSLVLDKFVTNIEKDRCDNHFIKDDLFIRKDYMPIGYNEINLYRLEKFVLTNSYLEVSAGDFYKIDDMILNFY